MSYQFTIAWGIPNITQKEKRDKILKEKIQGKISL